MPVVQLAARRKGLTMAAVLATCEHCGKEFEVQEREIRRGYGRFCSIACGNRARAKKREPVPPKPVVLCDICGKELNGRAKRFCSDGCRAEASRRYENGRNLEMDNKRITPRGFTCVVCGTAVVTEYGDKRRRFCSDGCRVQYHRNLHGADAKARRRVRKRDAFVERVHRQEICERDHWRCQLCGKKVDKGKVVPHPFAPVLDHIVPLACGGTHEMANVQLAHFICNSRKSAGVWGDGEQLRLVG